jgi:hypothetical protein
MTSPETTDVDAQMITAVLRHFDWSPASKAPGLYEVWKPDEDLDDEQVLLPLDPNRGDYEYLMGRAQRAVLDHYGRAARELLDVIKMRTRARLNCTQWSKETSLASGIITWEDGEELYGAARGQLIASAKSSREKRRYHGNASAFLAKQFLESTLMGQTDVGSFIITAYTPAWQRFHVSKHSEEVAWAKPRESETVSGDVILVTFERALTALRSVLDSYKANPQLESFLETVDEGVSFEFARALGAFARGGESAIQITRQAMPNERPVEVEFAFTPVEAPVIARAATLFALDPEPQDVTLTGEVTLLSRTIAGNDQLIRLNIEDGADVRKARIRLSPEQYEMAMEAHRREASLKVTGRLEKDGQLYWLHNASDLSLVDNDDTLSEQESPPPPMLF